MLEVVFLWASDVTTCPSCIDYFRSEVIEKEKRSSDTGYELFSLLDLGDLLTLLDGTRMFVTVSNENKCGDNQNSQLIVID